MVFLRPAAAATACMFMLSVLLLLGAAEALAIADRQEHKAASAGRERISLNKGWRFKRWTSNPDGLVYDKRQDTPGQAQVLKSWILPSANNFIGDVAKYYKRPAGEPSGDIPFAEATYDDREWEGLDLPHDWAAKGPFYTGDNVAVGGGMGRLPIQGIAWYRRKITVGPEDEGKRVYLDVDGAMSYAMVWINGNLAGGWPFGYNSFRVDLTPHLKPGEDNQLAIRLDNPVESSRWYPGSGIYRNVWLVKVDETHVAHWGTFVTTEGATAERATVQLAVQVENSGKESREVEVSTEVYMFDPKTRGLGAKVATFASKTATVTAGQKQTVNTSTTVEKPQLWGPPPTQRPNLHVAVTRLVVGNKTVDTYETRFGIRALNATGEGLLVNGERIYLQGVNQHHDLGALGAAFNYRAAQRQLEVLHELGSNAIRMAHNPPAPELLDLTDEMGFLVMDEAFDCWQKQKNPNDFHLIFDEWSEADVRAMMRRDRNHPSIFSWSIGNEVGEQTDGANGESIGRRLSAIVHQEDPFRGSTASMNVAKPDQPFPRSLDIMSLNYQGEGIRDSGGYVDFPGTRTPPMYPDFHKAFPNALLLSSETAAALSTRGTYFFPVAEEFSAPQTDEAGGGGDPLLRQVSAYELYTAPFGASPDKVFQKQDENPYVAGEFVWTGWDYLGEPTPYYSARSSYFGIVDLCGFKKDRFHLYQARWRRDLKTTHILPHWNWPDRVGQVTPVHVFSAADEAELFLNGKTLGRIKKDGASNYRFRWDDVKYAAGTLQVVTYKGGKEWANDTVRTTGAAAQLRLTADRAEIQADGYDLSFLTLEVVDEKGEVVPQASNAVSFAVSSGEGEIVATDNGDPYDMVAFPSKERKAFGGMALAIVRAKSGMNGAFTVTATAAGLAAAEVTVTAL
ncbi:glycoside hydrolase family 2 protein [Chaetomium fimeti]|uniref:Glycoside hydrolase family 2 protein n=1 Tax=Chaetomium fimeti TaxID=1854472 RepID=A0AAE0HCD9_9PEZI|nr:glycoside hydrolase family 2 protein [Chaetomium fimeti]